MISPLGNKLSSLKFEDKDIGKVYFEDKVVYRKFVPVYTPVTAIVASNKEQWVDTGLGKGWWTDDIEFEVKVKFTETSAAAFGQRARSKFFHYDLVYGDSANMPPMLHRSSNNDTEIYLSVPVTKKEEPTIVTYKLDTGLLYVDGNNKNGTAKNWTDTNRNFALKDSFYLFRLNQYDESATDSLNDNGIRTIYYLKMWYRGKKVIDYIPVLDENGVPCFFDKVTQKFIYSAGPQPLEYIE